MDLIATVNFGLILKELHSREHVQLHIQGVVVALEFVPAAHSKRLHQTAGEVTSSQLCDTQGSSENSGEPSSGCSASQSGKEKLLNYSIFVFLVTVDMVYVHLLDDRVLLR